MHHVYVIQNEEAGWYIGYSQDPTERLKEHNRGKNISTSKCKKWKLIYVESYVEKLDALGREKFLKSGSGRSYLKNK